MMQSSSEAWTEKYRPKKLIEVVGNVKAVGDLKEWADSIHKSKSEKAAILHGPPGSGKTSAAYALASEKGWEVIELNASDQRNEGVIKSIVGPASTNNTFSKTTRLIILDEADNLHGNEDRGGTRAITEIVKRSPQPIVLIANDLYKMGKGLQHNCRVIRFQRIRTERIVRVLKRLCAQEEIEVEEEALRTLAENANGDLRSAINDLQASSISNRGRRIARGDIATGKRDFEESIFDVLKKIFGEYEQGQGLGYGMQEVLHAVYSLDKTPEESISWVYANLPNAYEIDEGGNFLRGLHFLSRADIFLARTRSRENYKFWRYATSIMACGVFSTKAVREKREWQPRRRYHQYKSPWQRAGTGAGNGEDRKYGVVKEEVAKKIGAYCKVPLQYARAIIIPLLAVSFRDAGKAAAIAALLRLDVPEIAFLVGDAVEDAKEQTKRVKKIYQDAVAITVEKREEVVKAVAVTQKRSEVPLEVELIKLKELENAGPKKAEEKELKAQKTLEEFF